MLGKVFKFNTKIHYKALIFILCLGLFVVFKLYWLASYSFILWGIYYVFSRIFKAFKKNGAVKLLRGITLVFFLFVVAISTKLLVGDIYKIPSASMNNTLYTNDVILVNKLKYGPKLPRSPFEIPWLNIAFYFNDNAKKRIHDNWWPYKRLSGYSQIKHGDVVVFSMPFGSNKNMVIVKRCMALAGDTISIKQGNVYINNDYFSPSELILNTYKFEVDNRKAFYKAIDSIGFDAYFNRIKPNTFKGTLSFQDKTKLEQLSMVNNLVKVTDSIGEKSTVFPNSEFNQWNLDEYGPYIIPKKGMSIDLTPENFALYSHVINTYENITLKFADGIYYLNGKTVKNYTFKQDYYFMMGDNRKGSQDSRVWGLVPEERIIGKVQCVLWSNYQDEFQWGRLLKAVE
jgi:signal peptidase I